MKVNRESWENTSDGKTFTFSTMYCVSYLHIFKLISVKVNYREIIWASSIGYITKEIYVHLSGLITFDTGENLFDL